MKTLIIVSLCFISTGSLTAQKNNSISLRSRDQLQVEDQAQVKNQYSDSLQLKNKNELGSKNQLGHSDQSLSTDKLKRKKDVFVDKDGDGINDNRVSGMSFSKIRKRYQNKQGGHGGSGNNKNNGSGHGG